MRRRVRMVDLAREVCGGSIVGRRVAVLGAAFKPNSDDIRDSPALSVAAQMQLQGAQVTVDGPAGDRQRPQEVAGPALRGDRRRGRRDADVVLLLTEWAEYVALDPVALGARVGGADPRRPQLPRPGHLARRRLDLPRAGPPVTCVVPSGGQPAT